MSTVKIGKSWMQQGGTNTVIQIFLPTDNKQGAILRTVSLQMGAGASTGSQAALYADTIAPTAPGDGSRRAIAVARISTNQIGSSILPYEIEIPAGLGLWLGCQNYAGIQITWDFIEV